MAQAISDRLACLTNMASSIAASKLAVRDTTTDARLDGSFLHNPDAVIQHGADARAEVRTVLSTCSAILCNDPTEAPAPPCHYSCCFAGLGGYSQDTSLGRCECFPAAARPALKRAGWQDCRFGSRILVLVGPLATPQLHPCCCEG